MSPEGMQTFAPVGKERPLAVPTLTVVVPARDEADKIAATIDALMMADYEGLRVLVVDDRSTDGTGAIVDACVEEYAERRPGRLSAIHITELPEGWLGKTFALMVATENSASDYLLFTDADVLFSPSVLRRALVCAQEQRADHLVVLPTVEVRSRGEGIVLGFLQVMGIWASRPWKVEDPKARRDVAGIGAFNLVRRECAERDWRMAAAAAGGARRRYAGTEDEGCGDAAADGVCAGHGAGALGARAGMGCWSI